VNEKYYNPELRIKRCSRCKQWLSYDEFPKNKTQNSGLNRQCKRCASERRARPGFVYGDRMQIRLREDGMIRCSKCRTYLAADCFHKDKNSKYGVTSLCKKCVKEYYHRNSDRMLANTVNWKNKNVDKFRSYQREYRKVHPLTPEKSRISTDRRVRRLESLDNTFTQNEWLFALEYFHGCCAVCGRQLNDLMGTHTASADHWYPLSKGGATTALNIVPLCHGLDGCNNKKHANDPVKWLTKEFGKRKAGKILKRIQDYFNVVSKKA